MRSLRYATSADGTSLAWCKDGKGPAMVKAANWLTHLDHDLSSPVWSHWIEFLESHFTLLRYDERGCGLSDRRVQNLTIDHWVDDLHSVIETSAIERPFYLLGISQGAATSIAYSVQHPENVAGLILVGGYARGSNHRGPQAAETYKAVVDIFRVGWGKDNPAFHDVFTSRFLPEATPELRRWYTELCQNTVSPESGADLLMARAEVNVEDLLSRVTVPCLVLHARDDQVIPFDEGRLLAQRIASAHMTVLEGKNHIFLKDEPAWREFSETLLEFTRINGPVNLDELTDREQEVLRGICLAKSNKEIARDLGVSEKTVRNHTSNLFAKLRLENRQHAIRQYGHLF